MDLHAFLLAGLFFAAAVLYSAVGHAGASGYLAAMALVGMAPASMKPTALVLNVLVASITTFRFCRAGHFSWRVFLPFALGAVPFAFVGGALVIPGRAYKVAVGVILLVAAVQMFRSSRRVRTADEQAVAPLPPLLPAVLCGAAIGLLSGLTGTGGGIFLSPLLLALHWASTKTTAAVSAAFILANSLAGLAGNTASVNALPETSSLCLWLVAVGIGGLLGSQLGSRRLGVPVLRQLLAVVLVIASVKLMLA